MKGLTESLPKPMLPVHGKPILEHIADGVMEAGISSFCIVTGWQAEAIEDHFSRQPCHGREIHFVRQSVQDGTGRAADPARAFVGEDAFLLTYGDILVRPETYRRMVARFDEGDFSGLITVTAGVDVTKGAINFFDQDFCLSRIVEKPSQTDLARLRAEGWLRPGEPAWYNAGIYIFKPSLFEFTGRIGKSPRGEYELTDAIADMIAAGHRLAGLEIQGRWVDVRDPEVLAALERDAG